MSEIPTMPQAVMILLGLLGTGFLGLLVFICNGALSSLKEQGNELKSMLLFMTAAQEQIKTLFLHDEVIRDDIRDIQMRTSHIQHPQRLR